MVMHIRSILMALVMAIAASFGGVAALAASSTSTETLLKLLGYDAFVAGVAETISDADNDIAGSDVGFGIAWNQAATQVFSPTEMLNEILLELEGDLEPSEIEAATAFLKSDLGVLVTQMEVEAQAPGRSGQVQEEGAAILAQLIADKAPRLDKYTEMIEAFSSIDSSVAGAMNISFAIYSGMTQSGKMPFEMSEAEILGAIASQENAVRAQVRDNIYLTTAYTYRDLPDADLEEYIAFLTSKTGRALYGAVNLATENVLARRARLFGGKLMDLQGIREL